MSLFRRSGPEFHVYEIIFSRFVPKLKAELLVLEIIQNETNSVCIITWSE